jgi:hypothetical protein
MCEACAKLLLISSVVLCPPLHPFQKFLCMEKLRERVQGKGRPYQLNSSQLHVDEIGYMKELQVTDVVLQIRIRVDLYSFQLLEPDPYLKYGLRSRSSH